MPALENPKWERFCQEYVKSGNATQAYHLAGYKNTPSARANSTRLIATDAIKTRLAELGEKVLEAWEVDLKWWTTRAKRMAELPNRCVTAAQEIAAVKAATPIMDLLAQHLGALKPKQHEFSGPGGAPIATASTSETLAVISGVGGGGAARAPADMSDAELRLALAQVAAANAASAAPKLISESPPAPPLL